MQRPPRDPARPLLTLALIMRTGLVSVVMMAGAYWLFLYEMQIEGETVASARTAVVNVIVAVEIGYLLNCRSLTRSAFSIGLLTNRWAIGGAAAMIVAQLLFTYAPVMNRLFHTAPIGGAAWLRIAAVALAAFVVIEIEKWLRFGRGRGEHALPE